MGLLDMFYGGNRSQQSGPSMLPWQNTPGYQQPNYGSQPPNYMGAAGQQGGGTSLAEAIPSIMYNFKGINTGPSQDIANKQQQITGAQTDINNPLYQQIYGQQKQQSQQSLADSIQELSNQNRKLASMGRVPLFDAERGGEQMFRGLTQGYQTAQNQAAGNTQNILSNAGSSLNQQAGNATNLAMLQNMNQMQQAKGETGIAGILKNLFSL